MAPVNPGTCLGAGIRQPFCQKLDTRNRRVGQSGYLQVPARVSAGTRTGICRYPHGYPQVPARVSAGTRTGIRRYPHGYPQVPARVSAGTRTGIRRYPHGYPQVPAWVSAGTCPSKLTG
ncbi:hypothetical protein PTTG_02482, partial [Puccinia triticina 1-1 BBBD Race 1]